MYNHAADNYRCPICLAIHGIESDETMIKQADIFYRDDLVLGFISSKFIPGSEGHPLVVPTKHIENIYDMPTECGHRIMELSREVSKALKVVRVCDGVKIAQNNEPAAGQHAFHYHMHVIPLFDGDDFHNQLLNVRVSEPEERIEYAQDLRKYFMNSQSL